MTEEGESPPALGRAAIVAAVAVGVPLRLYTTSHLWLDEALTVDIARLPVGDIPGALRHDGHPPLFYVLLHGWMAVFGEGDTAVRALSGILALAALPLAWLAGRRLAGRAGAWWALGLFALCPFTLRYGTEARMYALCMVLVLAGWLLVHRALEAPTLGRLVPISLVVGLLLLAHYWSLWLVAATVLVLAWHARPAGAHAVRRVLVAVVAGGALLVPWLPAMLDQSAHTGTPWALPVRPTTMVATALTDIGGGDFSEATLLGIALLALFVLGITARRSGATTMEIDVRTVPGVRAEAWVVGLTLGIASVVGYATHTTFASRYVAVVVPLFLLVAAVGASRLPAGRAAVAALAVVLVLGAVGGVHNLVTERTQAGPIGDAIRVGAQPGDVVAICPDQLGPAVHRVVPTDLRQLAFPPSDALAPDRVDWRDYGDRNGAADPHAFASSVLTTAASTGAHSVWLVWDGSYRTLEGQCEAVLNDLTSALGAGEVVVADDAAVFEHAELRRLPGPATKP